jgi:mannose-6-phosphate isomerase-like protein (cupin superfamily)
MADARIVRNGDGEVYEQFWQFKHGSLTGGRFDFMVGSIEYLSGPPLHVHEEQDDTFFVLEGVLTVQVGDEVHDIGPGDFATVPPGVPHTFDNIRKDQPPVKVCNLMTPGGLDRLFAETTGPAAQARDPEEALRIRKKHGITHVGPTLREKLGLS